MNTPTPQITNTKLVEMLRTYWAWRRLWIATTIAFGGFGLFYVLCLKSDKWTASQGLIVRDEANGAVMRLGRFQSQTEMKAAQETILEMARNTQVLREALLEVGPEKTWLGSGKMTESWPSQREVSDLADESIGVRAPKGAEFGTTEVIYLDIKQSSRERAIALNRAVCKALDNRLRQVRLARADGVINELVRASSMAIDELRKATEQLQIIEREAGADLSDLRGLSENNGASSTSRTQLEAVKTELRQIENQHANLTTDLALLRETQTDPERILSAPASILSLHPGLKKLREGLADAQLSSSQLRGRYADNHPLVFVALSAEKEIKGELQSELALAMAAASNEVENSQRRIESLKRQQTQLEDRLTRLAQIRASHENYNQEVRSRTKILQDAERQLADTRAARDAALSTSLLTRIDEPVLGERPVGPGRTTILGGMTVAGLFLGLGIVFLLTPLDGSTPSEERWNERLGRRISDRFPWLADQAPGGGPRRRRTDVERRQGNRAAATAPATTSSSWFGRRQSDQQTPQTNVAASLPVVAAPVVQVEDPAIANRLDAMLLSELSAVIPAKPIEAQATEELSPTASLADDTAEPTVEVPAIEPVAPTLAAALPSIPETLSEQVNTQVDIIDQPVLASAVEIRTPEILTPIANIESLQSQLSELNDTNKPTQSEATPSVSSGPVEHILAESIPTLPTNTPKKKPTKPRLVDRGAPRKFVAKSTDEQVEQQPSQPLQPPSPMPIVEAPLVAPAPVVTPMVTPIAFAAPQALSVPVPSPVPVPAPMPMPAPMSAPVVAVQSELKVESQAVKPTKPGMNMFRPNQAVDAQVPPLREPQRPRRADGKSNPPPAMPAAPAAPLPLPLPLPANAFETPLEGGLAGIGLPTQKLPDSLQFRQS